VKIILIQALACFIKSLNKILLFSAILNEDCTYRDAHFVSLYYLRLLWTLSIIQIY